jgi:EAL domain-containing protein (putative c-di-GMP-specific phosphodiesterase class I)
LRAAVAASEGLPVERFVSLNVSPALILAGGELHAILAARTRRIVLEVTEHDTTHDYGALRSAFVALGSGLRLAVDDAGAGRTPCRFRASSAVLEFGGDLHELRPGARRGD